GFNTEKIYKTIKKPGVNEYYISGVVNLTGNIYFGFQGKDLMDETSHVYGFYRAEIYVDSQKIFSYKMDRIPFKKGRDINTFIEYKHWVNTKNHFIRSLVEPNNQLSFYETIHNGIYNFTGKGTKQVKILVSDYHGNTASCTFTVNMNTSRIAKNRSDIYTDIIPVFDNCYYKENDIIIQFYKNSLYDTLKLRYIKDTVKLNSRYVSNIHYIHSNVVPIKDSITIKILPKGTIPNNLKNKVHVVEVGSTFDYNAGGYWDGDFMCTAIKKFGKYALKIDTIPPSIKSIHVYQGANLSARKCIFFTITDSGSGIASYDVYIDNTWVIAYLDAKSNLLKVCFQDTRQIQFGKKHDLLVIVKDRVGNIREFKSNFYK
ncbi:MAG: hypothetical protein SNJ71_03220, partial [Bacteroidales bacterium]